MPAQQGSVRADASHVSGLLSNIILNQRVDEKVNNSESWDQNQRLLLHCWGLKSFGSKAKLSYLFGLKYCSTEVHRDLCPSVFKGPEFNSCSLQRGKGRNTVYLTLSTWWNRRVKRGVLLNDIKKGGEGSSRNSILMINIKGLQFKLIFDTLFYNSVPFNSIPFIFIIFHSHF